MLINVSGINGQPVEPQLRPLLFKDRFLTLVKRVEYRHQSHFCQLWTKPSGSDLISLLRKLSLVELQPNLVSVILLIRSSPTTIKQKHLGRMWGIILHDEQ